MSKSIVGEVKSSYMSYAMSVIVSRAIPDVRDGLKPVHRRVVYSMFDTGCFYNTAYKKSAKIVGEVMGKYHPHGDTAIYDSLVRMAQPFSLRVPLVDGQGNFGSVDGDSPAAMRYTEARLSKQAHLMVNAIREKTVDFVPNYDSSITEPVVLPAEFPNILVNGIGGVAVGLATNIPPHDFAEVISAVQLLINNPLASLTDIMQVMQGPDFPTGATVIGRAAIRDYFETGRAILTVRAKTHFEDITANKQAIIVTELPYQVNKARMIEHIASLVIEKKVEGVSDLRDESDRRGMRVVIELKRSVDPDLVLNQLLRFSQLQTSFAVNMVALRDGQPCLMPVKEILTSFISFRREVVYRRTSFRLSKATERVHVLIGLAVAVLNIDEVVAIIKASSSVEEAVKSLSSKQWVIPEYYLQIIEKIGDNTEIVSSKYCQLTDEQSKSILEMRLSKLTALEQDKLDVELKKLVEDIMMYLEILSKDEVLMGVVYDELENVKNSFPSIRKTEMVQGDVEIDMDDLIQKEDMVVIITGDGYVKRVPLSLYRAQHRGGRGRQGQNLRDEDVVHEIFSTHTHADMLFFSNGGKVYKSRVYNLPSGDHTTRGRSLRNFFELQSAEVMTSIMTVPEGSEDGSEHNLGIVFVTDSGKVRRNALSDFLHVPKSGKIAMKLEDDECLVSVQCCDQNSDLFVSTYFGKSIRFAIERLRIFKSRSSSGVTGIRLSQGDRVVSASLVKSARISVNNFEDDSEENNTENEIEESLDVLNKDSDTTSTQELEEEFILTITENGYGKRTSSSEYRETNRGGVGIMNIITSKRNGNVVASFPVNHGEQVIIMTDRGRVIRMTVDSIRVISRNTKGVLLVRVDKGEKVATVTSVTVNVEDDASDCPSDNAELTDTNMESDSV